MNSIAIAFKQKDSSESFQNSGEISSNLSAPTNNIDTASSTDSFSDADAEKDTMELHINLWKIRSGWSQIPIKYYIDFGIKTSFKNNSILIYVPFSLKKEDQWEDLGEIICNNTALLCAIFNEEIKAVPNQKNKCFYEVSSNSYLQEEADSFKDFFFYSLDKGSLTIREDSDSKGNWIEINIPSQTIDCKGKDYYIRFRLQIEDITQIAYRSNISNDLIQAAFSKLDMYDLRINDHRNLGKKIKEKIQKEGYHYPIFCKVHVFYISSPKTSVKNGSTVMCDSRIIEPKIWKDYQPSKYYESCTIAHHWKFVSKHNQRKDKSVPQKIGNQADKVAANKQLYNINLFFTAKYPKIVYATLIAYFAIIVLLGALGSWLADFLPVSDSSDGIPSVIRWDWNLKTYILTGLLGWIVIHWIVRHVRILFKVIFRFD